jgi:hypothetical protein
MGDSEVEALGLTTGRIENDSPFSEISEEIGEMEEDSSSPVTTIGGSLSRKRQQTSTLLEETSEQMRRQSQMSKRSRQQASPAGSCSSITSASTEDMEAAMTLLEDSSDLLPREVSNATEVDDEAEILPKTKVKAKEGSLPILEIQKLAQHRTVSGDRTCHMALFENIFTLISCLVCERVTTSGVTMSNDEKLSLYRTIYYEQCGVCGIDSYLEENLFRYVSDVFPRGPDQKIEWPSAYTTYIQNRYQLTKLTGTQKNRTRSLYKLTEEEGMKLNFSYAIKNAAGQAKTEINNRLSRLWRHPLESGENTSGLLDVIRETTRRRDAFLRARTHVNNQRVPESKRHGPEYAASIERKQSALLSEMRSDYFPNYWLTFALYGPPAPSDNQLVIFMTKSVDELQKKFVSATDGKYLSRNARGVQKKKGNSVSNNLPPPFPRAAATSSPLSIDLTEGGDSVTGGPGGGRRGGRGGGGTSVEVHHNHHAPRPPPEPTSDVGKLEKLIDVMRRAGTLPDGTYVMQDDITAYTRELTQLLIKDLRGPAQQPAQQPAEDEWMRVD